MTNTQIKKNIELSNKLTIDMMRHPNKFKHVADKATIIVIPKNDKKLEEENRKMIEKIKRRKHLYVATQIKDGWRVSKFKK